MRLRSALTAAALATGASLTPASARAQAQFSMYNRWYQATGCDYAFADVFGAGPRLCATAIVGVSDRSNTLLITQANIFAYNWYSAGASLLDPGVGFSPGTFGIDGGLNACRAFTCIGAISEGIVEDAYTAPGYVPQYLTMNVRYYQVPHGFLDPVDLGRASTFRLEATVIPEPATFVLLAGGLATLGAVSRGARRRRTRAEG